MRSLLKFIASLISWTAVLLALPASAAASEFASLAGYLNPDGTMNLPKDFVGSLDPAGFRMVQEKGEAPRFVDEKTVQGKSGLFGVPFGCNGAVSALARAPSGIIYMGGLFTVCEDVLASRVISYDPQTRLFHALGSGAGNGVNGSVSALAVSGSNLYVGGYFTQAGGRSAKYVARWNGSVWSSLGSGNGVNNFVLALDVSGNDLYIGGRFTQVDDIPVSYVARWNGNVWSSLGSGVNNFVLALAVSGSDLYVGGQFTQAGGVPTNRVARWNGNVWSSLGTGSGNAVNSDVRALAVSGSDLYVGGNFTHAGGAPANKVARWNGSVWVSLVDGVGGGGSLGAYVNALAVSGSDLYVGGQFTQAGEVPANYVARWNGNVWSSLGNGSGNGLSTSVLALAVSGSKLYVGGNFTQAGGVPASRVGHWTDGHWSSLGSGSGNGVNSSVFALAVSGSDLYVGGLFTQAGSVPANNVACWNGSIWSSLGDGIGNGVNGQVRALTVSGSDLYVGGLYTRAGGIPANNLARWNGSAWSSLGSGSNGVNNFVFGLAVSGSDLYVGGAFTQAGGVPANYVARWNGSVWSSLGTGSGNGLSGSVDPYVRALAVSGNDLYVGGFFTQAGGVSANHVARWNGSAWSSLSTSSGNGVNNFVLALAVSGSDLYVGGNFTHAGGIQANYVARWNGSVWSGLGSGVAGEFGVGALVVSGSDLYVGGSFTQAGDIPTNGLARWDGSTWQGLATDAPPQSVTALAIDGASLFASGTGITQTPLPRLESANAGALANAPSAGGVASRTGTKIAFSSTASNLAANENNPLADIFVRTPASNAITRVSDFARQAGGAEAYTAPTISADGSVVGFQGSLGQISALDNGTGRLVSRAANGTPGNGPSTSPALSRNGLRLIYQSLASNLTPADNNSMSDVIMTNLQTGANELISVSLTGQAANGPSFAPWPNEDGSIVALISLATNLTSEVQQKAGTVRQALVTRNGGLGRSGIYASRNLSNNQLGNGDSNNIRITPDGRYGVFESLASNLVADDTNGVSDIFRFEIANQQLVKLERFSVSTFGLQGNGPSRNASISDDGRFVTFETDASNLVGLDNNGATDVLVKAFDTRETIRLSRTIDDVQPNGPSVAPSFSGDGSTIVFGSGATNLTPNDNNQASDIFSVEIAGPDTVIAPESGWYWDPAQGGRGYFFERKASGSVFMAGFLYENNGRALWFTAQGAMNGNVFTSPMSTFTGGQTLSGPYKAPAAGPVLGTVTMSFTTANTAQLTMPGTSINLVRFPFATGGMLASPQSGAPEKGWWWSAMEGGRGYAIEFQGDQIFIIAFMYDNAGNPIWYLAGGSMTSPTRYLGSWSQFANGQALGQPYRAPEQINANAGSVVFNFTGTDAGTLTLPDGRQVAITRFPF